MLLQEFLVISVTMTIQAAAAGFLKGRLFVSSLSFKLLKVARSVQSYVVSCDFLVDLTRS